MTCLLRDLKVVADAALNSSSDECTDADTTRWNPWVNMWVLKYFLPAVVCFMCDFFLNES